MAESWVRLWAGTSTDPKFRVIARKSGQPLALVLSSFMHLMLEANESDPRGSVEHVDADLLAAALDMDEEAAEAILEAMQGRVIVDGRLSGWEKRQPVREDSGNERTGALSATERSRRHRERKRAEAECNAMQRNATQCNAPEAEADTEADTEADPLPTHSSDPKRYHSEPRDEHRAGKPAVDGVVESMPHVEIAVALREAGMQANANHPKVVGWAKAGVSPSVALEALEIARGRKRDGPIPVGYLDPIIHELMNPKPRQGTQHAAGRQSGETAFERVMRLNGGGDERPPARVIDGEVEHVH